MDILSTYFFQVSCWFQPLFSDSSRKGIFNRLALIMCLLLDITLPLYGFFLLSEVKSWSQINLMEIWIYSNQRKDWRFNKHSHSQYISGPALFWIQPIFPFCSRRKTSPVLTENHEIIINLKLLNILILYQYYSLHYLCWNHLNRL